MSLFKTKEWWRTVCGAQETFDGRCLLVTPLFGEEKKDAIVVGSHDGYLRIYSPSSQWIEETRSPSGYKSTDTMLETQIGDCIVDIKAGKFVSGSQDLRLAILTSSKLLVYNAILIDGSTEYGDRCDLKVAYEHSLPRHPASLTTGPFGGVRGRDFLCVQCLDGTLFFYEQEVFVFSQVLKNRLLPEPIVYIARNDLFVTASTSWFLECYRYQSMAESVRIKERRESNVDAVDNDDDNHEEEVEEQQLHHHHHRQRQWQRERRPIPADSHEPDWRYNIGEAILDIQAVTLSSFEAGIVVLGERHLYCLKDNCTSVKYAKRLEYKPLCFRAYVIEPDGKLMVLVIADTSTLMIYEGTRLKWSAQLPFAPVTVARAQLQHLDGAIMALSEEGRLEACYLGSEPGLFIAPPLHSRRYDYAAAEQQLADLRALLKRKKSSDDRHSIETRIHVDGDLPAIACEIDVIVSYRRDTEDGNLRTVRKTSQLPLKMMLQSCPPENVTTFTTVLKGDDHQPLLGLARLFPEFTGDRTQTGQKQNWTALGLRYTRNGQGVTIVSGNASNRYRVQSNDGLSTTLVVRQLIDRLADRKYGNLSGTIGQDHLRLMHSRIEAHYNARRKIDGITNAIGLLTIQLRNIEKKMLRAVRERNTGSSLSDTGLPFLFESTYRAILERLEDLVEARAERERAGHELYCSARLLLLILRMNTNEEKYATIEAAIGFEPRPCDKLDWEEIADAALATILRSVTKNPGTTETKSITWNSITPFASVKELAKLKKRLGHAIERLDEAKGSDIAEIEPNDLASS
ncbi:PREDICTED: protein PTHB1 [Dufourea novaeangliae]|uniref:protein PTHB1 n=1 Tax=Dufourea novaeangliae TaxID=178035 RepID=UPI000766EF5A|nr:PREDICTED: protein PTHB1 [Dufourea novaeangliae]